MLAHGSDSDENTPPMLARQIDFGERTIVLGSDPEEGEGEQDDLLTDDGEGAAGDLLTEDEASPDSPSDNVPLVSLGRKFLSESQFGAVANWVVESPGASGRLQLARQEKEEEDRLVEDLLRDTPETQKPSSFSSSRVSGGSSQQTSKAGLSEGSSRADLSSQGTSKDLSSQGTSKAGASWNQMASLDDTLDEFDKMCLTPKAKTSFSAASKSISIQVTPQNRPARARKISPQIQPSNNQRAGHGSTSSTREAAASAEVESRQESLHLRLSPSQDDQSSIRPPPSSHSPLSMAGGDTMLTMPNATLNLDGVGSGGSVTFNSTVDSKRPIDNSVAGAAVRSWTPNLTKLGKARQEDKDKSGQVGRIWGNLDVSNVPSSVSEHMEGQVKARSRKESSNSSSGEEALSKFLTKVVSSRKQVLAFFWESSFFFFR